MKSSIQVILFFLLGLVASLALPFKRQTPTQFAVVDFSGGAACHSILTSCRKTADYCCPGLRCEDIDGEALCVPAG